jgi:cytochrome c oxidase subunit 2
MDELIRRLLFLPEQATEMAVSVDRLHFVVIMTTMLGFAALAGAATYFVFAYRKKRDFATTPRVEPNFIFESLAVGIPTVLFLAWFFVGYKQYVDFDTPPANSMEVYVMGKQWMWKFNYPDGPSSIGVLTVPAKRPVKLLMTSRDVIHSFFIPAFRVKRDALPGRYTEMWFQATKPGRYPVYCAEYCGLNHSSMLAEVVVLEPNEYDAWFERQKRGLKGTQDAGGLPRVELTSQVGLPPGSEPVITPATGTLVEQGRTAAAKQGCLKCHSVDGSAHIGPTWRDLFGATIKLKTGETLVANEEYITESMMDPLAKVVAGYEPVMPTYQGRITPAETAAIIEYIKSLRSERLEPGLRPGPQFKHETPSVGGQK